jgi:phage regulator Rha-like protein
MKQNIILKSNLETTIADMRKQGYTIREIANSLSGKIQVDISYSSIFRFLKKTEMKQIATTDLKQEMQSDVNQSSQKVKQEAKPQKVIKFTSKQPGEFDDYGRNRAFTFWQ